MTDDQQSIFRDEATSKALARRGVPAALVQGDGDLGSTVEHETPEALFDALDAEFGPFTLDPATSLGYHTSDVIIARGGTICVQEIPYTSWDVFPPGVPGFTNILENGLTQPWTGRVWLNHPYGRDDWRWIKKAHDSVRFGDAEIVVALVPVKTQMRWWHKYVGATDIECQSSSPFVTVNGDAVSMREYYATSWAKRWNARVGYHGADVIRFVKGRLRFGGAPSSAPFNSAIIVWRK